jgi:hypothetical protein
MANYAKTGVVGVVHLEKPVEETLTSEVIVPEKTEET